MKIVLGLPDKRVKLWELDVPLMINQLVWDSVEWENETWVDSGGYQIMVRKMQISVDAVLDKYKRLDADYYISLDIPATPCEKPSELNFKHFEYLYTKFDNKKIIPVIHAYDVESIKKAIDFYSQYTDYIAFGGIVPPSLNKVASQKLAVAMYRLVRKEWKGKIHVLGAGSPFMRKVFYDADSVDTSTYRVKAIHGMVLLPGKGERYVGERKISWGARRISEDELESLKAFLEKTHYPFPIRFDNWMDRSLVNAWVLLHSEYEEDNPLIRYAHNITDPEAEINELCRRL